MTWLSGSCFSKKIPTQNVMCQGSFCQPFHIHDLQQVWSVKQLLEGIHKAMNITDEHCFFWEKKKKTLVTFEQASWYNNCKSFGQLMWTFFQICHICWLSKKLFETPWWQLLMQDAGDRSWCWTDGLFHIHVQVLMLAQGASGTLAGELWHVCSLAAAENLIAN